MRFSLPGVVYIGTPAEQLLSEMQSQSCLGDIKMKWLFSAMRKKRVFFAIILVIASVIGVALWYPIAHQEKSIGARYSRIRDGMTVADVESLLGGQLIETQKLNQATEVMETGVPEEALIRLGMRKGAPNRGADATHYKLWHADSWWVGVWFDTSGAVVDKEGYIYFEQGSPSFLQRLFTKLSL